MKTFELDLIALEPLVITSGSAESMAHECLGYIPGNMLLGAFAARWIAAHPGDNPDDSEDFRRLFLDGAVSWGHALPLCGEHATVPVPRCYMRVKNHPSLPEHGEYDKTKNYFVFNVIAFNNGEGTQEVWKKIFPNSQENIKTKKLPPDFMDPQSLHLASQRRVWNTHVALDKQRSAMEGQLFGYSAIAPGSHFRSIVEYSENVAEKELAHLLGQYSELSVGHSRSAGYGRVKMAFCPGRQAQARRFQNNGRKCRFFFLSQYLPKPEWENPYESFLNELEKMFADNNAIVRAECRSFGDFTEIQGFSGIWKRPRTARTGLAMGTVIEVEFDKELSADYEFLKKGYLRLGSGQIEGYGRILINPDFLARDIPKIGGEEDKEAGKARYEAGLDACGSPLWQVWRQRSMARLAQDQARAWLGKPAWSAFLESVKRLPKPTASQRNHLRNIDKNRFAELLEKTPGKQWEQAVCANPFNGGKGNVYLSEVILRLLDIEKFLELFPVEKGARKLPGGPPDKEEEDRFDRHAHKLFIRELLAEWNNLANMEARQGAKYEDF